MTLRERVNYLQYVCESLTDVSSLNMKRQIINQIQPECKEDFEFIIEILAGKHKLGYTYQCKESLDIIPASVYQLTFKEYLLPLFYPLQQHDLSEAFVLACIKSCRWFTDFVSSIVNRTLRLGIGNSLIEKTVVSPMLAKKYEGQWLPDDIYITEKLDGNRCIAQYCNGKWVFTSRNGKEMHVDFDMSCFDKDLIYDGEVISENQHLASIKRSFKQDFHDDQEFNTTSGLINQHTLDKKLVYKIFDITNTGLTYSKRRELLTEIDNKLPVDCFYNVDILPILSRNKNDCDTLLDYIVNTGGEGIMINTGSGLYQQKRTNDLLKYKQVQTIDLRVIDWEYGTGKYEFSLGYLICEGEVNGNKVSCKVGTGLSDEQREQWALTPELIIGKIVEVAYFSLSQNVNTIGTKTYSLRFPRLKSVRNDKTETSEF